MNYTAETKISEACYSKLVKRIEDELGATFSKIRERQLKEAIAELAARSGFRDIDGYISDLLEKSHIENIDEFAKHLTIGESYFFRHHKTFDSLKSRIIPELIKKSNKPLKIWCAGCSGGQEPYTVAITILESQLLDKTQFNIFGSDINSDFLKEASKAEYTDWSFRETSYERLGKYFVTTSTGKHRLNENIRKLVQFKNINLHCQNYPFTDLDIIFCRNVLIYFSQKQINNIKTRLVNILKPGGWLITAPSEVPLINDPSLELIQDNGLFFFRKRSSEDYRVKLLNAAMQAVTVDEQPITETAPAVQKHKISYSFTRNNSKTSTTEIKPRRQVHSFKDIINLLDSGKYEDAAIKLTDITGLTVSPCEYLELASKLANCGQFNNALKCIEAALATDNINSDAIYQKAVILNAMNRTEEARKSFEQVIFLRPDHIGAYFSLGTMLLKVDKKAAMKKLKIAAELARSLGDDQVITGTRDLTKQDMELFIKNCCEFGDKYEC